MLEKNTNIMCNNISKPVTDKGWHRFIDICIKYEFCEHVYDKVKTIVEFAQFLVLSILFTASLILCLLDTYTSSLSELLQAHIEF
ncbi:hypothetical protein SAMN05444162_4860 [Paenibacillaceae bacterium GAS479]|nr:hypothetical protein SAMN05444162_4860 [Paenibacillaceae bacterium GAS479]